MEPAESINLEVVIGYAKRYAREQYENAERTWKQGSSPDIRAASLIASLKWARLIDILNGNIVE